MRNVENRPPGTPRASTGKAITMASAEDVLAIAWANLGPRWLSGAPRILYPADDEYVCPSVEDALAIVRASKVDRDEYYPGGFDCDDFAYVLKAELCEAAYTDGPTRTPYCFGIVWCASSAHALNWMINDDGILRLVEPQTGELVPLANYSQFYLALI